MGQTLRDIKRKPLFYQKDSRGGFLYFISKSDISTF